MGCSESSWTAGWSRHCHEKFVYPSPEQDAETFIKCIREKMRELGGALVLAMTERTTLPLSAHRDDVIEAGGILVLPPHGTVLTAFDKLQTIKLAQSLSIQVPQTVVIDRSTSVADVIPTLRYPVVLKPRASEEMNSAGAVKTTGAPLYARNEEDLRWAIGELRRRASSILVQEFIEGRGAGYFALMRHGELRAEFAHERIREVRPSGSGSALRRSVRPDPRVREAGLAILRALRWHGVAMVEFRLRSDGLPVLMEVNGRFWNSLALAIYAGVDFPVLLAQLAELEDLPAESNYREGVRCRWLLGDFRHVIDVWRGRPRGYPAKYPARLRTLCDFLVPVPGTFHDNFQWDDPLPELGDWLHFFFRKLPAALKPFRVVLEGAHAQRRDAHP
jgi:predicted ATP-grasp superfamily ATP-dependent carboligase